MQTAHLVEEAIAQVADSGQLCFRQGRLETEVPSFQAAQGYRHHDGIACDLARAVFYNAQAVSERKHTCAGMSRALGQQSPVDVRAMQHTARADATHVL